MKNISVICIVYNEEKRIKNFLLNFRWSDDLVIIDKSSHDTTREIAQKYTPRLFVIPYTEKATDIIPIINQARNEWVLFVTASDIIHPKLVQTMLEVINRPGFDYDAIYYPYANFVFGINDKRSPWHLRYKGFLIRRAAIDVRDCMHFDMRCSSGKYYTIPYSEEYVVTHLTHESLDTFYERHLRYTRCEADSYNEEPKAAFRKSLRSLLRSTKTVIVEKKTFMLGWDGIALTLAYISYFIMEFLFVWQKYRARGPEVYSKMRERSVKEWDNFNSGQK